MLIYSAADIHGRREHLAVVASHIAAYRPDVLILAGDISRWHRPDAALGPLGRLPVPVLLVRGNSDRRQLDVLLLRYANLRSLHLARETIDHVDFVGCGGTLPLPFHSRLGFNESAMTKCLSKLLTPGSVLVVHPPPYGVRDRVLGKCHAGSRAVRRLVDRYSPALVICGHIHEQSGVERYGDTVVANCAVNHTCGGVLIRYDGQRMPHCSILPFALP